MEFKKTGFNSVNFNQPQNINFAGNKPSCGKKEENSQQEKTHVSSALWQKIMKVVKFMDDSDDAQKILNDEETKKSGINPNNPSLKNPETGEFDPNLLKLWEYFSQKYKETGCVSRGHMTEITSHLPLFVNENTGEVDENLVNFTEKYLIWPYTEEGRKEYATKRETEMLPYYVSRVLCGLLKGIKDKTSASNQNNIIQIEKLVSGGNPALLSGSKLPWVSAIKDENGIIEPEKMDYLISHKKDFSCPEQVEDFANGMRILGVKKADNFYKKLSKAFGVKSGGYTALNAFLPAISFCYDEDGNFNKKKFDIISDVGEYLNGTLVDEKILKFIQPKENRDLIKELDKKGYEFTSDDTELFASLVEKCSDENGAITPSLKEKVLKYVNKDLDLKRFTINYNSSMSKEGSEADFDEKKFKQLNVFYETKLKNCPYYDRASNKYLQVIIGNKDISSLNFKEKLVMLGTLDEILSKNKDDSDIQELSPLLERLQIELNMKSPVLSIQDKDKKPFMETVLGYKGVSKGELSHFEEVMINSIPKLKEMHEGLPLLYSRKDFIKDINKICNTDEKKEAFKNKTGVELTCDSEGKILYYDGLINMNNFNLSDEFENSLYNICCKFFYENSIQTGDRELDCELNKIIKASPEFINTIGRAQHRTQKYSLDIHQLLVLANSIKNPDYKKLRNQDKIILKAACIFHDIMKKEAVVDKGHQNPSSIQARDIANKFFSSPEVITRFYELVKNHHWLEEYNMSDNKNKTAEKMAFMFRRPYDFEIAKIMARSDLMAVSDDFYERYKYALSEGNIQEINNKLKDFYSTGCVILSDYPKLEKISDKHKETLNGIQHDVINFNEIKNDTDLSEYGFNCNKTKEDIQLLVHMVGDDNTKSDLDNLNLLLKSTEHGILSESLIDVINPKTFLDRKYGVILSQINSNIINASRYNQGSSSEKDDERMLYYIFKNYGERKKSLQTILGYMGISSYLISKEELAEFYKDNLADKTSLSQFVDDKEYRLGDKKFSGRDLKKAIFEYQRRLITKSGDMNNEIIGYEPEIKAVMAKEKSLKDVPSSLLYFAHKNNLPVVLI